MSEENAISAITAIEPEALAPTSPIAQAIRQRDQFRDLITRALEYLNVQNVTIIPSPESVLEVKKREAVGSKFDAVQGNERETLRRVVEYLLIHGKTDSVMMSRDTTLGSEAAILDAIDHGHKSGLLRWTFEIHSRHLIMVNPSLQNALAGYLWGEINV